MIYLKIEGFDRFEGLSDNLDNESWATELRAELSFLKKEYVIHLEQPKYRFNQFRFNFWRKVSIFIQRGIKVMSKRIFFFLN